MNSLIYSYYALYNKLHASFKPIHFLSDWLIAHNSISIIAGIFIQLFQLSLCYNKFPFSMHTETIMTIIYWTNICQIICFVIAHAHIKIFTLNSKIIRLISRNSSKTRREHYTCLVNLLGGMFCFVIPGYLRSTFKEVYYEPTPNNIKKV